jgi:hypothetical protein
MAGIFGIIAHGRWNRHELVTKWSGVTNNVTGDVDPATDAVNKVRSTFRRKESPLAPDAWQHFIFAQRRVTCARRENQPPCRHKALLQPTYKHSREWFHPSHVLPLPLYLWS